MTSTALGMTSTALGMTSGALENTFYLHAVVLNSIKTFRMQSAGPFPTSWARRALGGYSTGMRQRVKLAQALVHDPDLLFLDEPTNGMDPKGREEMLELIRDLAHNKNVNLILSSHLLPDVEYTCDHVVVMDKAMVVAQGPIGELKGPAGRVFELRVKFRFAGS